MLFDVRFKLSYNSQTGLDGVGKFVVGKVVSILRWDVNRLLPLFDEVKIDFKVNELVGRYIRDSGFYKDEFVWWSKGAGVKKLILLIKIGPKCPATIEVKRNADSEAGNELLKRRNGTIERIIGYIKERLRVRRFSLRGLVKVGVNEHFLFYL